MFLCLFLADVKCLWMLSQVQSRQESPVWWPLTGVTTQAISTNKNNRKYNISLDRKRSTVSTRNIFQPLTNSKHVRNSSLAFFFHGHCPWIFTHLFHTNIQLLTHIGYYYYWHPFTINSREKKQHVEQRAPEFGNLGFWRIGANYTLSHLHLSNPMWLLDF